MCVHTYIHVLHCVRNLFTNHPASSVHTYTVMIYRQRIITIQFIQCKLQFIYNYIYIYIYTYMRIVLMDVNIIYDRCHGQPTSATPIAQTKVERKFTTEGTGEECSIHWGSFVAASVRMWGLVSAGERLLQVLSAECHIPALCVRMHIPCKYSCSFGFWDYHSNSTKCTSHNKTYIVHLQRQQVSISQYICMYVRIYVHWWLI